MLGHFLEANRFILYSDCVWKFMADLIGFYVYLKGKIYGSFRVSIDKENGIIWGHTREKKKREFCDCSGAMNNTNAQCIRRRKLIKKNT